MYYSEMGLIREQHSGSLLVTPINMFHTPMWSFLSMTWLKRDARAGFCAYTPTWFNRSKMVVSETYAPVAITRYAVIWLGVAFLFLFVTRNTYRFSWGMVILPWRLACFHITFPPSAAFFNCKMAFFDAPIAVNTVVTFDLKPDIQLLIHNCRNT